jgi:hypothetical protein
MNFSTQYPEYNAVVDHIRRAQAENSVHLAHRLADAVMVAVRFARRLAAPRRFSQREA